MPPAEAEAGEGDSGHEGQRQEGAEGAGFHVCPVGQDHALIIRAFRLNARMLAHFGLREFRGPRNLDRPLAVFLPEPAPRVGGEKPHGEIQATCLPVQGLPFPAGQALPLPVPRQVPAPL